VSTPVTWEEVEAVAASGNPDDLVFEATEVLARVEAHGDLFASLCELEQTLPAPPQ
jgi:bifunctional non-homologous end joining protein LigD